MRHHRVLSLSLLCLFILGNVQVAHSDDPGFRPRNLALSRHGAIVVATSWGSNSISQLRRDGSGVLQPVEHINLGAESWDVVILEAYDQTVTFQTFAIVTHPKTSKISVLTVGIDAGGPTFTVNPPTYHTGIPYFATAMIPSPTPGCVLIAFRGATPNDPNAPTGSDSWTHVVREFNFVWGTFTGKEFTTEREPSSLCMSPDDEILYVGHIQGALGQQGLFADTTFAGNPSSIFDGGSILAFDFNTTSPVARYPIGSPVRDVQIFPPHGTDAADYPVGMNPPSGGDAGDYVLYFTHTGDGSPSEHPLAGGKEIVNAISSIRFDPNHVPSAPDGDPRKDVIFNHTPGLNAGPGIPGDPQFEYVDTGVLPEQVAFHLDGSQWSMWATFSGSGVVGSAPIDVDGRVETTGTDHSVDTLDLWVVTARGNDGFIFRDRGAGTAELQPATPTNMTLSYELVAQASFIRIDQGGATNERIQSSNPRGIVVDPENGRVLVVAQFDGKLVDINAVGSGTDHICLLGGGCAFNSNRGVTVAERNFFTYGRGFDFRELGTNASSLQQTDDKVDNLACSTCHAEGHIDGKVRLSAIVKINSNLDNPLAPGIVRVDQGTDRQRKFKAIAVPSVFDSGASEWLFFEGLQTTVDSKETTTPIGDCSYCGFGFAGIFLQTQDFATAVPSPRSAYHNAGLSSAQSRGRDVFEELNCSRCHSGDLYESFVRTPLDASVLPNGDPDGPIFAINGAQAPLSDPAQVFIQTTGSLGLSARNMTLVGSRPDGEAREVNGVNTPSLFGAWDNAPYLHDGRYRTLLEVLDHTWLDLANGLSAPLLPSADAFPDNLTDRYFDGVNFGDTISKINSETVDFGTHAHTDTVQPSVSSALSTTDRDALLAFLGVLSSEVDLECPTEIGVSSFAGVTSAYDAATSTGTLDLSWDTDFTASCEVSIVNTAESVNIVLVTAGNTTHSVQVEDLRTCVDYTITITPVNRVCGTFATPFVSTVYVSELVNGLSITNFASLAAPYCEPVRLTWDTANCVPTTLEWGLKTKRGGYPNVVNTPAGTTHTVYVPVEVGMRYKARITPLNGVTTGDYYWNVDFCFASKEPGEISAPILKTQIASIRPNPFNPSTTISYELLRSTHVSLRVFDVRGRLIATLLDTNVDAGAHQLQWRGIADSGDAVASGVYFVRFEADGVQDVQRAVLLK